MRKSSLVMIILNISCCTWILGAPSQLVKLPNDDENIGKTVLIHPSAGEFVLIEDWYFGKKPDDSYFSSSLSTPEIEAAPKLYKIIAEYRTVNHGAKRELVGRGYNNYLLKPVNSKPQKRLFFFFYRFCEEKPNLIDEATGIKINFVCERKGN